MLMAVPAARSIIALGRKKRNPRLAISSVGESVSTSSMQRSAGSAGRCMEDVVEGGFGGDEDHDSRSMLLGGVADADQHHRGEEDGGGPEMIQGLSLFQSCKKFYSDYVSVFSKRAHRRSVDVNFVLRVPICPKDGETLLWSSVVLNPLGQTLFGCCTRRGPPRGRCGTREQNSAEEVMFGSPPRKGGHLAGAYGSLDGAAAPPPESLFAGIPKELHPDDFFRDAAQRPPGFLMPIDTNALKTTQDVDLVSLGGLIGFYLFTRPAVPAE